MPLGGAVHEHDVCFLKVSDQGCLETVSIQGLAWNNMLTCF